MHKCVLSVDVGTNSARAALYTMQDFKCLAYATNEISVYKPEYGWFEQSTKEIWDAVVHSIAKCLDHGSKILNLARSDVASCIQAIAFDAACSLVLCGKDNEPFDLTQKQQQTDSSNLDDSNPTRRDVIMWMDHRAIEQVDSINRTKHPVLASVGGVMSPEMQLPKLLWLKQHAPDSFTNISKAFDLADWLTYRCTGVSTRSLCTVTCKWTYQPDVSDEDVDSENALSTIHGWKADFFDQIGLSDLLLNTAVMISGDTCRGEALIKLPGSVIGTLSLEASRELQLPVGIPIAAGLIDAHAGGIGLLACVQPFSAFKSIERPMTNILCETVCMVTGTSACHMKLSPVPITVPGSWGAYYSAMLPRLWLTESGQSGFAVTLSHIISTHAAFSELVTSDQSEHPNSSKSLLKDVTPDHFRRLNELVEELSIQEYGSKKEWYRLGKDVHVYPDLVGNRSPLAQPSMTGMISGLTIDTSLNSLVRLYVAAMQSLALQTYEIISSMISSGHHIKRVVLTGGPARNHMLMQCIADASLDRFEHFVYLPEQGDAVLLGNAINAASCLQSATTQDSGMAFTQNQIQDTLQSIPPSNNLDFYRAKYTIFKEMQNSQIRCHSLMNRACW